MEKPDFFEIKYIDRYLNGKLTVDQLKEFERQITLDPVLKEKVEKIKIMPNDLFIIEKDRLAQNVKKWIDIDRSSDVQNSPKERGTLTPLSKRILGIAAIFILIVSAIWLFLSTNTPDQKAQLYMAQLHQDPIVLRGSSNDSWELAIENYTNRDFDKMIDEMKKWIENKNSTAEQLFYFALANLYCSHQSYEIALDYFAKTEQKDPTTYKDEITWYRALIFIKRKEYEEARSELMKLGPTDRYGQNAEDLLKKF